MLADGLPDDGVVDELGPHEPPSRELVAIHARPEATHRTHGKPVEVAPKRTKHGFEVVRGHVSVNDRRKKARAIRPALLYLASCSCDLTSAPNQPHRASRFAPAGRTGAG